MLHLVFLWIKIKSIDIWFCLIVIKMEELIMIALICAAGFGILLGIILILFTIFKRRALPMWSIILFGGTGVMIMLSCVLILAGAMQM